MVDGLKAGEEVTVTLAGTQATVIRKLVRIRARRKPFLPFLHLLMHCHDNCVIANFQSSEIVASQLFDFSQDETATQRYCPCTHSTRRNLRIALLYMSRLNLEARHNTNGQNTHDWLVEYPEEEENVAQ